MEIRRKLGVGLRLGMFAAVGSAGMALGQAGSVAPSQQTGAAAKQEAVQPAKQETVQQAVTVTATRSGVEVGSAGRTVESLTGEQLRQFPALTLDEELRQEAGFELFRRSSGWVQNPTSQGISLRGLGSTAASRTLVLEDNAPLNDPFGGWIHWNEVPPEAIEAVTIATGGGSDLYGSSALGGVIDVVPGRPVKPLAAFTLSGAGEDTAEASGRGDLRQGKWGELVAAQGFRTDGYILTAPGVRGPIDRPANVHYETGRVEVDRDLARSGRAFLVGNLLNEARGNGTPDQTNGTRLWRYMAGDDWKAGDAWSGRARAFGSDEAYRQTFSSINATRTTEALTRVQHVETQELGATGDATWQHRGVAVVVGADARDIRGSDIETPISGGAPSGLQDTTARQRFVGGFVEALAQHGGWSGAASLRVDGAENLDIAMLSRTGATSTRTAPPDHNETVVSPRLGVSRQVGQQVKVHAAGFRAFRAPTMNELYRTGQVGQETTEANASLVSERATGAEAGVEWAPKTGLVRVDGTYFWTEINRPVSAVELSSTATTILEKRENLGQIQSQGMELHARVAEGRWLSAAFGYQYAHAVVTAFSAQPSLVGNWIPEVPREMATAQVRAESRRLGTFILAARESGRAYDDSGNVYVLHSFFAMDVYGERSFARRWTAFVGIQNLLNRQIDVARTPLQTLGTPFTAQGGVRFRWGG